MGEIFCPGCSMRVEDPDLVACPACGSPLYGDEEQQQASGDRGWDFFWEGSFSGGSDAPSAEGVSESVGSVASAAAGAGVLSDVTGTVAGAAGDVAATVVGTAASVVDAGSTVGDAAEAAGDLLGAIVGLLGDS
jgi:hypothetical protein